MICFNDIEITFSNMGLFISHEPWIHPARVINSFEIIYVIEGDFDMKENNKIYHLRPQTVFFLEAGLNHCGVLKSTSTVKFYWLHFYCNDFYKLNLKKTYSDFEILPLTHIFQEIMSLQQVKNKLLCEVLLTEFILKLSNTDTLNYPKVVSEIIEYIRLNIQKPVTVKEVCFKFGYSTDHCSRIIKKTTGLSLNSLINATRINHIKTCLLNTNYSIKQISNICGFEDENSFVKFFKYHTKKTPSEYRNTHNGLHMNNS